MKTGDDNHNDACGQGTTKGAFTNRFPSHFELRGKGVPGVRAMMLRAETMHIAI